MKKIYNYSNLDVINMTTNLGNAIICQNFMYTANDLYTLYTAMQGKQPKNTVLGVRWKEKTIIVPSIQAEDTIHIINSEIQLISWKVQFIEKWGNVKLNSFTNEGETTLCHECKVDSKYMIARQKYMDAKANWCNNNTCE